MHCDYRSIRGSRCSTTLSLGLLAISALSPGCTGPLDHALDEAVRRRLGPIERIALEEHSAEPTITAAQAAEAGAEPITDPQPPDTVREITIEEVRATALRYNLGLQVERLDPLIAAEILTEEEARFEAVFFGNTRYADTDPRINREVPSLGSPGVEQWASEVGIEVPLRTGGTATVSTSHFAQGVKLPGVADEHEIAARFSISQPLLRNAGYAVNQAPIRVAAAQHYQASARTRLAAIRVMTEAERAYWRFAFTARQVEVQRQLYENGLEQLRRAQRLAEEGVVAGIEAERARAGLSRHVDAVIVAETQRRQAERQLKRIMNHPDLPVDGPTTLIPVSDPNPIYLALDAENFTRHAMQHRMEMLDLELQLAIDAIQVDLARNRTLPLVALQFDYSFRGTHNSAGRAFNAMLHDDISDWLVGAEVRIPLGNEAARAVLRRALLQRLRTAGSKADQVEQIKQDVHDALDQLQQNWRRILAARREVVLQGRIYEAEQRQFQAGTVTMTEVLDAAQFLADAQIREIDALTDYEIAKVEFAYATGTVLGHGRVHWEGDQTYERLLPSER